MMRDCELIGRYKDFAPGVRLAKECACCGNCAHFQGDPELIACAKHAHMYHDWDQAQETSFEFRLMSDNFEAAIESRRAV
jgi:hypothetical protein